MHPHQRGGAKAGRNGSAVNGKTVSINGAVDPFEEVLHERSATEELKSAAVTVKVDAPEADEAKVDHEEGGEGEDLNASSDEDEDAWESESILEDIVAAMSGDMDEDADPEHQLPPEEAAALRCQLREQGPVVWCERNFDSGLYSPEKLLSVFGIQTPNFLVGQPRESFYPFLSIAISRELSRREKLTQYNTVDDVVSLIDKSKNIMVITGAGISTSLGIPDFRSKGTGLYSKLEHLGLGDPQEVFEIGLFREDPSIFYSVAKDIIPAGDRFTPTHKFIAMLHERGKLLTNYSQNIDNLEVKAGVPLDRLIQCHGSFGTATCIKCGYKCIGEEIFPEIRDGKIPRCGKCLQSLRPGGVLKRKRSANSIEKAKRKKGKGDDDDDDEDDEEYDIPSAGVMKPDITFFGEELPDAFHNRLTEHDREKVDLVIVIGTSLKVAPVSEISSFLPANVPQVYVSREAVSHINFDVDLLGDCDVVVSELCRRLGWEMRHEMVPEGEVVDVRGVEGHGSRHVLEARKDEQEGK